MNGFLAWGAKLAGGLLVSVLLFQVSVLRHRSAALTMRS